MSVSWVRLEREGASQGSRRDGRDSLATPGGPALSESGESRISSPLPQAGESRAPPPKPLAGASRAAPTVTGPASLPTLSFQRGSGRGGGRVPGERAPQPFPRRARAGRARGKESSLCPLLLSSLRSRARLPSRPPPYHASGEMRHFDRQCRVGVPPEGLSCPQLKLAGGEKKIAPGGARPRRRPRRAQRSPPATSVRQLVAPLVKDGCLSVCLSSVAVAIRGHQACQAPSCSSCCCCRRRRRRT